MKNIKIYIDSFGGRWNSIFICYNIFFLLSNKIIVLSIFVLRNELLIIIIFNKPIKIFIFFTYEKILSNITFSTDTLKIKQIEISFFIVRWIFVSWRIARDKSNLFPLFELIHAKSDEKFALSID